jgi:hypothetical protein
MCEQRATQRVDEILAPTKILERARARAARQDRGEGLCDGAARNEMAVVEGWGGYKKRSRARAAGGCGCARLKSPAIGKKRAGEHLAAAVRGRCVRGIRERFGGGCHGGSKKGRRFICRGSRKGEWRAKARQARHTKRMKGAGEAAVCSCGRRQRRRQRQKRGSRARPLAPITARSGSTAGRGKTGTSPRSCSGTRG